MMMLDDSVNKCFKDRMLEKNFDLDSLLVETFLNALLADEYPCSSIFFIPCSVIVLVQVTSLGCSWTRQ